MADLRLHCPRNTEITNPKIPTIIRPRMSRIGGKPPWLAPSEGAKVGATTGGAGVNVGGRVGVIGFRLNCAARVGSIVAVTRGVGVGGGSTTGSPPA